MLDQVPSCSHAPVLLADVCARKREQSEVNRNNGVVISDPGGGGGGGVEQSCGHAVMTVAGAHASDLKSRFF